MSKLLKINDKRWLNPSLWTCTVIAGGLLPFMADSYVVRAVSIFNLYLLLGAGLTIVVSYAGLLNLGYIAFYAIGAYTYALLNTLFGLPFFLAIPLGMVIASLFGLLIGIPTLRVRGDYLALVTLAFGEIVRNVVQNIWGPHGISGIQPPLAAAAVGGVANLYFLFYYVTFIPVPIALGLLWCLDRSRMANVLFAIRDNETAAQTCGIRSMRWLLLSLVIAGAAAGFAGVVFAGIQRFVSPGSFQIEESIFVLSIVVIAGGRSRWRLVLAAAILSLLPEVLRGMEAYRMLIYGSLLSLYVVFEEVIGKALSCRRNPPESVVSEAIVRSSATTKPLPGELKQSASDWTLAVTGLTMRFGGILAVNDVSFEVQLASRIVALIGPNGAGKTTLFNCISGQCRPAQGDIVFPDNPKVRSPGNIARIGIGRTFQTPHLFHTMTVRENIELGALRSEGIGARKQTADRVIKYLGIEPIANSITSTLPLGFQRLTELGRALAAHPKVILIDEIASGLNSGEKQLMAAILRQLAKDANIGFLVVEHDMDFVLPLASEILVLETGKLIARGTAAEITHNQQVIDAYLGREHAAA